MSSFGIRKKLKQEIIAAWDGIIAPPETLIAKSEGPELKTAGFVLAGVFALTVLGTAAVIATNPAEKHDHREHSRNHNPAPSAK